MKIGILGCGYVGQSIALHWKNQGHHVTATTRSKERVFQLKNFVNDIYILKEGSLSSFIEQQEILVITIAPDRGMDYARTYLQVAEQAALAISQASSLRQIIYTSSTSLYGERKGEWVNEETPLVDLDENRKILQQTEQILLGCESVHLSVCILRLGEIYGPGRRIEDRLKKMQDQSFAGTGESFTNLIHLDDIVSALDFAVLKKLQGIYNLCSDFHIPRKEFYAQICQQEKMKSIQWDSARHSPHGGNRRVSNQKIKNAGLKFIHLHY